jgi:hypothetical protein
MKPSGTCKVSVNIINGTGKISWATKLQNEDAYDSGLRIFSDVEEFYDTDEMGQFIESSDNWVTLTYEDVIIREPLLATLYNMPIDTDANFICIGANRYVIFAHRDSIAFLDEPNGLSLVSRNIFENKGTLKRCIREKHNFGEYGNGWKFISDIDTDEYITTQDNFVMMFFEVVMVQFERRVGGLLNMPTGTDLTLVQNGNDKFFVDTATNKIVYPKPLSNRGWRIWDNGDRGPWQHPLVKILNKLF